MLRRVTLPSCLQTLTPDCAFNLSLEDVTLPGVTLSSRSQTLTLGCAVPSGQILVYKAFCEMSKDQLAGAPAEARHKAIGSVDVKGVTSAADYEAVNAVLGRIVALVLNQTVMDVYYSMASVAVGTLPNNMFSKVNTLDADAAAQDFYVFKNTVEAAQCCAFESELALLGGGHCF